MKRGKNKTDRNTIRVNDNVIRRLKSLAYIDESYSDVLERVLDSLDFDKLESVIMVSDKPQPIILDQI